MNFDDAMDLVEIEDACRTLDLGEMMTALVLEAHRRSPSGPALLKTVLEHGGDHVAYVRKKAEILRQIRPDVP